MTEKEIRNKMSEIRTNINLELDPLEEKLKELQLEKLKSYVGKYFIYKDGETWDEGAVYVIEHFKERGTDYVKTNWIFHNVDDYENDWEINWNKPLQLQDFSFYEECTKKEYEEVRDELIQVLMNNENT